jgi:phenylalanyl-tRNA synthetase beta subunit
MEVELIDRFQRKEWLDKTSMAFRVVIGHPERTLVKDEIEEARMRAIKAVEAMGCELRS